LPRLRSTVTEVASPEAVQLTIRKPFRDATVRPVSLGGVAS
jgi:hypothetical protein